MTATSPAVTIVADGRVDERETKTPAETRDARESASSDDDGGDAESESESESEFEDEAVDAARATLDRQGLGDDDDVVADDVDERDTRVRLLLIRERDAEFAADRSFKSRSLTDLNNEAVRHLRVATTCGASCRTPNCLEKLPRWSLSEVFPCHRTILN